MPTDAALLDRLQSLWNTPPAPRTTDPPPDDALDPEPNGESLDDAGPAAGIDDDLAAAIHAAFDAGDRSPDRQCRGRYPPPDGCRAWQAALDRHADERLRHLSPPKESLDRD